MYNNKVALVTGGVRGIGMGISQSLSKSGFTIVAAGSRSPDDDGVTAAMENLQSFSSDSVYIQADISSSADRSRLIDEIRKKFGRLDILVNNAGVAPKVRDDLLDMSEESFDHVLNVNLKGSFFLTQYASQLMAEEPENRFRAVIFITSISASTSSISRGEYCISKAGLSMVATLFTDRLAPLGINVYEVRPGIIATDMTAGVRSKYDALISDGLLPIARIGTPADVGAIVSALAGGAFSYSTGDIINADGGFHISRL